MLPFSFHRQNTKATQNKGMPADIGSSETSIVASKSVAPGTELIEIPAGVGIPIG
jgi:hypothetical protein